MNLRIKMFSLVGGILLSLILLIVLSLVMVQDISHKQQVITEGTQLVSKARHSQKMMNNLVFDLFMPDMYSALKGMLLTPRTKITLREWEKSYQEMVSSFENFIQNESVISLLNTDELKDQYNTAQTISYKAFGLVESMKSTLQDLEDRNMIGVPGLYTKIQKDDDLIILFKQIKETSYYLNYTFEGFLNYFIEDIKEQAEKQQQDIIASYMMFAGLMVLLIIIFTIGFSRRLTQRVKEVDHAIGNLSTGDFSSRMYINSNDEFGRLADNFNIFCQVLRNNIDSVGDFTKEVKASIREDQSLEAILITAAKSILRDTHADGVDMALIGNKGKTLSSAALGGTCDLFSGPTLHVDESLFLQEVINGPASKYFQELPPDLLQEQSCFNPQTAAKSAICVPVVLRSEAQGIITVVSNSEEKPLMDLDFMHLKTFADYTALTLDNYKQYTELLEKREAEFQALQSQVQPHFLYNIMNSIVALNRKGDKKTLEQSVFALKKMMRYTLEHSETTTVEEELDFIRQYCELQKLRFGERLTWEVQLDEQVKQYMVPKLILQPLVENAVIHGIESQEDGGHIVVSINSGYSENKEYLLMEVSDNGAGFSPGILKKGSHIGLSNVKERLSIEYHDAGLMIESSPGNGTVITIHISKDEVI